MTITIVAYTQSPDNNARRGMMHIRFSTDYGATWTAEDKYLDGSSVGGFPMTPQGVDDQNMQSVIVNCPNGDLIMMMWAVDYDGNNDMIGSGTTLARSTDGGRNWSAAANITISGMDATENRNTFASDQAFVYDGVIYVTCIHYFDANYETLIKSTDSGVTWSKVAKITGTLLTGEAGVTYLGGGHMVAMIREALQNTAYRAFSNDMGVTWTQPQILAGWAPGGRYHVWTRAQLKGEANWWNDPVLIMCGFSRPSTERIPRIWVSKDAGANWSAPMDLDAGSNDGGYGDVIYDHNTGEYVCWMFWGSNLTADIKQYRFTLSGI